MLRVFASPGPWCGRAFQASACQQVQNGGGLVQIQAGRGGKGGGVGQQHAGARRRHEAAVPRLSDQKPLPALAFAAQAALAHQPQGACVQKVCLAAEFTQFAGGEGV